MGSSSPNRVENKKYLKPPTRYYTSHSITNPNFMHYYLRKNPSKLRYTCCLFDTRNMDIILRPTKWKPPSSKGGPLPRLIERCETNGTLIFLQCWKKGVHRWPFLPGHKPNISETPWNKSCENGDQKPITLKEKPITLKENLKSSPHDFRAGFKSLFFWRLFGGKTLSCLAPLFGVT